MRTERILYKELASAVLARRNCAESMARLNSNVVTADAPTTENEFHQKKEWFENFKKDPEFGGDKLDETVGLLRDAELNFAEPRRGAPPALPI